MLYHVCTKFVVIHFVCTGTYLEDRGSLTLGGCPGHSPGHSYAPFMYWIHAHMYFVHTRMYLVHTWLWQFGSGTPHLGGLTVEEALVLRIGRMLPASMNHVVCIRAYFQKLVTYCVIFAQKYEQKRTIAHCTYQYICTYLYVLSVYVSICVYLNICHMRTIRTYT